MKTEYMVENNKAVIFCNGEYIRDFEPYFYVEEGTPVPKVKNIKRVVKTNKRNLYGKPVSKVYATLPNYVRELRGMFAWTGEADIKFTKRYNIDKRIKQVNDNIIMMDIESITPRGADISAIGKYPISIVGLYSTKEGIYRQFVQKEGLIRKDMDFKWKDRRTGVYYLLKISQYPDEKELLKGVLGYLKFISPDMMVDYSTDGYDMSTIIERSIYHHLPVNALSPIGRINTKSHDIAGVESVPLIKFYKKWYPSELEQVDLHNICMKLFNVGKTKIVTDFVKEYEENFKEFLKYNMGDVELLKNFIEYTKIIDNINYIIHGIGCEFEDYYSSVSMVRHYLLGKAKEQGVVMDTWAYDNLYTFRGYNNALFDREDIELIEHRKDFNMGILRVKGAFKGRTHYDKIVKKLRKEYECDIFTLEGAYVLDPKKGIHSDVECFDWKSLYPSIMVAYNMSWETIVRYDERDKYNREDLFDIGNGVYFLKPHIKEGFLAKCITELFELRYSLQRKMVGLDKETKEYKDLNTQQTVVKFLINSFYGVMGLTCIWIAESVTHTGRLMAKWTVGKAQELGYDVLYGDTDSIYATNKTAPCSREKFADKLCEEFEREWKVHIEIKYEGYFPKALFITKKRYALLQETGKLKCRGIEIRRSDHPQFKKDIIESLIMQQFDGKSRKDIMQYIRDELEDIPNKAPTHLATTIRLNFERKDAKGNINPNKIDKAALKSNSILGKNYMTGDKPYYLHDVCFDYDHEVELTPNRIKFVKDGIYHSLEAYFKMFDWDLDELITGFRQKRFEI